jgi:hypothetical protein
MAASLPGGSRLDVGAALRDGWAAFQRAPWPFTGFAVLVSALSLGINLVDSLREQALGDLPAVSASLLLVCQLASWALSLWAGVGLVRGAWIALEGGRPCFVDLLRWDGPAFGRVLVASLLLTLILVLISVPLFLLMALGLVQLFDFSVPLDPLQILNSFTPTPAGIGLFLLAILALLVLLIYVQVNQHFLVQLASLRGDGAGRTLAEGRAVVDRQWWAVLGLVALEALLLLAGILALVVGLFVALPLTFCVSTAAYRQLFDPVGPATPRPST